MGLVQESQLRLFGINADSGWSLKRDLYLLLICLQAVQDVNSLMLL